jgi:hypothetical protein
MKIYFNYANTPRYLQKQKEAIDVNKSFNIFDALYGFNSNDIDEEFKSKHSNILNQSRGGGYWLWKSYFLDKLLQNSKENDIIVYGDASIKIIKDISPLFSILDETKGVMTFLAANGNDNFNPEKIHTKRDIFVALNCDTPYYYTGDYNCQFNGAFLLVKNNEFSKNFIKEFMYYCTNEQLITDSVSKYENHPEFRDNRHDQSILSLLSKKHNLYPYPDPTQWGNSYRGNSNVTEFLYHDRS